MKQRPSFQPRPIKASNLAVVVIFAAMFPRLLSAVGLPAAINFAHFAIVSGVFVLFCTSRVNRVSWSFIRAMAVLLILIYISALINDTGLVNILLEFLLLAEPFMLFLIIIDYPWSKNGTDKFRIWLVVIVSVHIIIAYYQRFVMGLPGDEVEGVFINMGAGAHLAGAVALSAGVWVLLGCKSYLMLFRWVFMVLAGTIVIISDSKQVIAVFLMALSMLIAFRLRSMKAVGRYILVALLAVTVVAVLAQTIVPQLRMFTDLELLGDGLAQKWSVFSIIISHFDSNLNWLFGLGPGHTVGRLGWLVPKYAESLQLFGVTASEVTDAVWKANQAHPLSNSITGSSAFSLLFSWVGVWGDLGIFGVGAYIYLWVLMWRQFASDDVAKYFIMTILLFGVVFSWMEEPGYILFLFSIMGLRWQERSRLTARGKCLTKDGGRPQLVQGVSSNPAWQPGRR